MSFRSNRQNSALKTRSITQYRYSRPTVQIQNSSRRIIIWNRLNGRRVTIQQILRWPFLINPEFLRHFITRPKNQCGRNTCTSVQSALFRLSYSHLHYRLDYGQESRQRLKFRKDVVVIMYMQAMHCCRNRVKMFRKRSCPVLKAVISTMCSVYPRQNSAFLSPRLNSSLSHHIAMIY